MISVSYFESWSDTQMPIPKLVMIGGRVDEFWNAYFSQKLVVSLPQILKENLFLFRVQRNQIIPHFTLPMCAQVIHEQLFFRWTIRKGLDNRSSKLSELPTVAEIFDHFLAFSIQVDVLLQLVLVLSKVASASTSIVSHFLTFFRKKKLKPSQINCQF